MSPDLALGVCIGVTLTNLAATFLLTRDARSQLALAKEQADTARAALTADVNRATESAARAIERFEARVAGLETAEARRSQANFAAMPGVPRR